MSEAPPGARKPSLLRAVFGATFLVRFGFGLTLSVFASYIAGRSENLDTSTFGVIGLIGAMAPIGEFSTVLLSGAAADRYGRLKVLVGGSAAAAVLMALVAATRVPIALGALNLLFGIASGAILASSLAVVTDASEGRGRGQQMGWFDAVNLLGWISGFAVGLGLLGAVFAGSDGNARLWTVFAAGAAALGGGALFARLTVGHVAEPVVVDALRFQRIRAMVFRRDVLLVTLPWLVIYMLLGTLFVFLGTASTSAGLPTDRLALLIGGGGLLLLFTQPSLGKLADRYGRMRLMWVGTIGFLGVLTGAALLTEYGARPELLALVGVSVLPALAYGPAALAALGDLTHTVARATTMSFYSLVISLGMLLGILASAELFAYLGTRGLLIFFGSVAAGLLSLTSLRYLDVRRGGTGVRA